jgi:hypothetical protein
MDFGADRLGDLMQDPLKARKRLQKPGCPRFGKPPLLHFGDNKK